MNFTTDEILERIEKNVLRQYMSNKGYSDFRKRLSDYFPGLYTHLMDLYGDRSDFLYQLEVIIETSCKISLKLQTVHKKSLKEKSGGLHKGSQEEVGAVFYVDLFAGKLKDIKGRIPYLKELGVTFIHLMPVFATPFGETDGGYAVSSYRDVDPGFGTMNDLKELIKVLDQNGISLILDFVLNHTSDQHEWAQKAKEGDPEYQNYYYLFDDQQQVDEYAPYLRDIFPEVRKGSFTFYELIKKWVWTTFNSYQWDLNYSNPAVFHQMIREMFFLAEAGVDVLRFDAPAFIWKEKGTGCENLPKVHTLIQAFKSVLSIGAPGVLFLSEAIVHPDEIEKYISVDECELSYNPLLMATLWESLATRKTSLLQKSMERYAALPEGCHWINYIRCHDDIGWTFSDQNAWDAGLDPAGHRKFLNEFYTGKFEGSFAKGLPFQENMQTGDLRISGTLASLAGLEKALTKETEIEVDIAIRRILLLYGIILSMNGFPLIYIGDEAGHLNDYSYTDNPEHKDDSRWVHRQSSSLPEKNANQYSSRIFDGLTKLIKIRKNCDAFTGNKVKVIDFHNCHIFGFIRMNPDNDKVTVVANFSEEKQDINLPEPSYDIISGTIYDTKIELDTYQILWLKGRKI